MSKEKFRVTNAVGEKTIIIEDYGRVRLIRLNRPEVLNALDVDTMMLFRENLVELQENSDIWAGVVTGTGDRGFCTGADLRNTTPPELPIAAAILEPEKSSIINGFYARSIQLGRLNNYKPLICAINGHAVGGGLELALACDIRVCSANATFGLPEVTVGSLAGAGGIQRLMRIVPRTEAMRMVLTGERIKADQALRLGLVSSIYDTPKEALAEALAIARKICENAPLSVRATKMLADVGQNMPLDHAIEKDQLLWALLLNTEDRIEGRQAFAEKRPPKFNGR
jgi:E-phenylitaconyl-CoA hydratase